MLHILPLLLLILQGPVHSEAPVESWQVRALVQHAVLLSQAPAVAVLKRVTLAPAPSQTSDEPAVTAKRPFASECRIELSPAYPAGDRTRDGPRAF